MKMKDSNQLVFADWCDGNRGEYLTLDDFCNSCIEKAEAEGVCVCCGEKIEPDEGEPQPSG